MVDYNKLYNTYITNKPAGKEIDYNAILLPYTQQCNIVITEDEIILGSDNNPLNKIPQKNIFAIVEEENKIHIILRASIYTIDKKTGAISLNIRNL
jgi:hypothetical protein